MAPAAEPSEAVVRDAIARVAERYVREVGAVIAHGSWVRGDFWPRQSDLDLIVVTGPETPREVQMNIKLEFEIAPSVTLRLHVEPWVMTENDLEAWRKCRSIDPRFLTLNDQLDIAGFDAVDYHVVLWPASGRDPLAGFPVPRGEDLQHAARVRVQHLLSVSQSEAWGEGQANRVACEALKAAMLFFVLKHDLPPTRDKRQIFQLFMNVVPDFPHRRDTAERIWNLYQAGDTDGGPQHREACHQFIGELDKLIEPFS